MSRNLWSLKDDQVEHFLGHLLRIGVILAAAVVLAGGVDYLIEHGKERADLSSIPPQHETLRSLSGIVHVALQGESEGIIQLGLLLLVATPIARVVFSVFAFALERDVTYVVITLIVLGVLLYSLMGSGHL